jgi:DNA-binding NtrC family response regulator
MNSQATLPPPALRFLIIEDDYLTRKGLRSILVKYGESQEVSTAKQAKEYLQNHPFDIVFIDLNLGTNNRLDGLDLIELATNCEAYPVVLTGEESDEIIEQAYRQGCRDYLIKPFKHSTLKQVLHRHQMVCHRDHFCQLIKDRFITNDPQLLTSLEELLTLNTIDQPIFLGGESGTGKSMLAKLLHQLSHPSMDNFVHLNCAEIPENLLESELFGHRKGAFSGATSHKQGKLELAHNGTLFLDEVATLSKKMQGKLLLALEEKCFTPVGGLTPVHSNFKLVSATCQSLSQLVQENLFRQDLYFRLEGMSITIPPLRERREDIPLIIRHLLRQGERRIIITASAMNSLTSYPWPGNVRELSHLIERLRHASNGIIQEDDLPAKIVKQMPIGAPAQHDSPLTNEQVRLVHERGLKVLMAKIEHDTVTLFYQKNRKRVRQTLKELQISNSSFYRILGHNHE